MQKLLSTLTKTRISPSTWAPTDALPSGSHKSVQTLKTPISSSTRLSFTATGAWSHGTVVFETRENLDPPTYDAAVSATTAVESKRRGAQLADGEGFLEIRIEGRWNDNDLWEEGKVELKKPRVNEVELSVTTPNMSPSRLASQLSFHITFSFPPSITSLASLSTSGSQWRTLGLQSLSTLHFNRVTISTANTPIAFVVLKTGTAEISTVNSRIEGAYSATVSSLTIKSSNGPLEGRFTAEHGQVNLHTTNAPIRAQVVADSIVVYNRNARVEGPFISKTSIAIDNSNAVIDGPFQASTGVKLSTSNAMLRGRFTVGDYVELKTSNAAIDASIILLPSTTSTSSTPSTSSYIGQAEVEAEAEDPSTPPLLPTYELKPQLSTETLKPEKSSQTPTSTVRVEAHTSNATVVVEIMDQPSGVNVDLRAETSNAGVTVKVPKPFVGKFDISTSNASAIVETPSNHTVEYSSQNHSSAVGGISTTSAVRNNANSWLRLKTSNGGVKLSVL